MFDKENAVKIMNKFGKQKLPFLFIINFDFKKSIVLPANKIDESKIKYSFRSEIPDKDKKLNNTIGFNVVPPSFDEFEKAFNIVQNEIKAGNTYLLNLTFSSEIIGNFNLYDIYKYANAPYKLYLKDKFTVFSPETFIKITDKKIYSYPMKGTIDADITNAENLILNDKKETAEHYTIVDLIRNDLNQVAKKVKVERFRYIDKIRTNYKNLLQVSSEISGKLPVNYNEQIGTILSKLLPAGSISGSPKKKTLEIIKAAETHNRNYYTGIAGFFDGKNLDSFVMIRFVEKNGNKFFFKSGGGITNLSNAQSEYDELCDKIYIPI